MTIQTKDIQEDIKRNVKAALKEDIGNGDITAQLIPADKTNTAQIITRESCIMCGAAWVNETFAQLDPDVTLDWKVNDGDPLQPDQLILELKGKTRSLLTGERTALNFLQLLCGIATTAHTYAAAAKASKIKILDTRKTIPGLRIAQKYAVGIGGCENHRIGLYDAFLIKENHIAACGSITEAIQAARNLSTHKKVEVEVETIDELKEAINAGADTVMLDNFSETMLKEASELNTETTEIEFSGNLTINDLNNRYLGNVDSMSFGALTKHAKAIDLSMRIN